jgi:hypothetical protein
LALAKPLTRSSPKPRNYREKQEKRATTLPSGSANGTDESFYEAQRRKEIALADLHELELATKRGDLHTLFDLGKISVHPEGYRVIVSQSLRKSVYWTFNGAKICPGIERTGPMRTY